MDITLVKSDNPSEIIAELSVPVVPIKGDYMFLFGQYYEVVERCLIIHSENGKTDTFKLLVKKA